MPSDGPVLADLLTRDEQAYARWLPARPAEFYTPEGQATVIASLPASHAQGLAWPGVVVAEGNVIGQVTVSSIPGASPTTTSAPTVPGATKCSGRGT